MDWSVIPKVWPGKRVFIVGGGTSLNNFDWRLLEGQHVLGCNAAAFLLPRGMVQWAVFGDKAFLRNFRSDLHKYVDEGGKLINASGRDPKPEEDWMLHIRRINGRKAWGISDDPGLLRWNRSTGACAMNVAFLLGSKDIVLLGYDLTANGDKHNWHRAYDPYYTKRTPESNAKWMPQPSPAIYHEMMMNAFTSVARDFQKFGVTVWNTNSKSKLKEFPFKPISELL
jgi:hypothetical protein